MVPRSDSETFFLFSIFFLIIIDCQKVTMCFLCKNNEVKAVITS